MGVDVGDLCDCVYGKNWEFDCGGVGDDVGDGVSGLVYGVRDGFCGLFCYFVCYCVCGVVVDIEYNIFCVGVWSEYFICGFVLWSVVERYYR